MSTKQAVIIESTIETTLRVTVKQNHQHNDVSIRQEIQHSVLEM